MDYPLGLPAPLIASNQGLLRARLKPNQRGRINKPFGIPRRSNEHNCGIFWHRFDLALAVERFLVSTMTPDHATTWVRIPFWPRV
jgi:hypothetical protein